MSEDIIKQLAEIATKQGVMDDSLKQQGKTLEKYSESLVKINETLLRNTITVEEHHRRSLQLEQNMEALKKEFEDDLEPIQEHVQQVRGVGKAIRLISYLTGAILGIAGVLKLIEFFGK